MKAYAFFLHDDPEAVPLFDLEEFADDAAAASHACELLTQEPQHDAIVIWDSVKAVAVTRGYAPAGGCAVQTLSA